MTAVVTGGASGMGESLVYALAKEGASIVVVDRNVVGANTVAANVQNQGSKAICVNADVQSTEDLAAMANKAMYTLGGINILVNYADTRIIKGFGKHTKEDWNKVSTGKMFQFDSAKEVAGILGLHRLRMSRALKSNDKKLRVGGYLFEK